MTKHTSALIRLIAWSFAALVLLFVLIGGICVGDFSGGYFYIGGNYDESAGFQIGGGTVAAGEISKIEIEWQNGEVSIESADTDAITFEESGASVLSERDRMRYRVKDGVLKIVYRGSSGVFHFGFGNLSAKNKHLTVRLPAQLQKLDIEAVSGAVHVNGMQTETLGIGEIDIETVSGALTLQNVTSERVALESVSGKIECNGTFGDIHTETVSGGTELVSLQAPRSADCESVSGKISLQIPENSGFSAKYESVSGKFSCEFPTSVTRERAVYGDGSRSYDFETISGNITILRTGA